MATVYSYARFSHRRQAGGDSLRRQRAKADAWLSRHPEHTLDATLTLTDAATSSYRGRNLDKDKGALGAFIALAKSGQIEPNSILLLERIDRFSRLPVRKAYHVFCEIVEAGCRIMTLDPEQEINEKNIDKIEIVFPVIIGMQLAHDESRKKSDLISRLWEKKRQQAAETPMTGTCPAWLRLRRGKWIVKPGTKEAIQYIFSAICEGVGTVTIARHMNKKYKPFGRAAAWYPAHVSRLIHNRALLGELQPHRQDEGGQRQPEGKVIENYYPRMVSDSVFDRANGHCCSHRKQRGRNGKWVNLFAGLIVGTDGYPRRIKQTDLVRPDGSHYVQRRLVSVGHLTGQEGASDISADYSTVERWVLIALREIKPDQLVGGIGKADVLTEKLAELAGVEARLEDIGRMLADPDTQLPPQIGKAMTSLTLKRERLQQEVEKARQENATADSKPLTQIRDIFDELETGTEAEIRNKRLKLRGLIACLVERIEIEGIRFGKKRAGTRIWVVMSSGPVATCYQYPDGTGGVSWGGVAWLPAKGKYCGEARPAR